MQLFNADSKIFLEKLKRKIWPQKAEKTPQKYAYLWQMKVFFSAAPPVRNSPEVYFHFINSPIHSYLLKSVHNLNK